MPSSELIINCSPFETRVACIEGGQVSELYIERNTAKGIVGNIYKGKVVKVLPGLQSAFVDIGFEKAAFLYVNDIVSADLEPEKIEGLRDAIDEGALEGYISDEEGTDLKLNPGEEEDQPHFSEIKEEVTQPARRIALIQDVLEEGKEIIVQVVKDMIGTKGARLTTYVSLPGRYLVYMPNVKHIGVSRRIQNEEERDRLKSFVQEMRTNDGGFIVRTASEGVESAKLKNDCDFLLKVWKDIGKKSKKQASPTLLHSDIGITLRAARDLFTKEVDRLVVDSLKEYQHLIKFVNAYFPRYRKNVIFYEGSDPIFERYGVNIEITRALGSKVWLKSGGYIIIEQTEALTSIDVNTGRYMGLKNLEATSLVTNLEAAKEIAVQLRLRNIGGIIVVDFIDMEKEDHKEKVFETFKDAFSLDRAKTNILKLSDLGLIQMTRKRTRESIGRILTEPCPHCEGYGRVKSKKTIAYAIMHDIYNLILNDKLKGVTVLTSREVMSQLYDIESHYLELFEKDLGIKIRIEPKEDVPVDYYDLILE